MKTGERAEDVIFNANWDALLKIFHKIESGNRKGYEALKELAKTKQLSPRQSEGIAARCDYQISLIDDPTQKPFSNMYRKDDRTMQLGKEQSNGKH